MGSHRRPGLFARLAARFFRPPTLLDDYDRARNLIAAIDRGGIPLNAAKVNAIARNLGLEVSTKAPPERTVERIRQALSRAPSHEK
ncbi:hypothetical protein LZ012_12465 [Dechloromonas sp. XY25]|uniref:Uncharacterized protein n=1 Tax=Dechloromonas hankyongensis TaxID=2908002 RepID=A0ABS9K3R0_9RHOO|nr:hypothetical protein [Dechloromonas hankyongensis]MCG2577807.1 hypothetical protein [Dechloromonas hankyongensis]